MGVGEAQGVGVAVAAGAVALPQGVGGAEALGHCEALGEGVGAKECVPPLPPKPPEALGRAAVALGAALREALAVGTRMSRLGRAAAPLVAFTTTTALPPMVMFRCTGPGAALLSAARGMRTSTALLLLLLLKLPSGGLSNPSTAAHTAGAAATQAQP